MVVIHQLDRVLIKVLVVAAVQLQQVHKVVLQYVLLVMVEQALHLQLMEPQQQELVAGEVLLLLDKEALVVVAMVVKMEQIIPVVAVVEIDVVEMVALEVLV